jgi:hypothetical protein
MEAKYVRKRYMDLVDNFIGSPQQLNKLIKDWECDKYWSEEIEYIPKHYN